MPNLDLVNLRHRWSWNPKRALHQPETLVLVQCEQVRKRAAAQLLRSRDIARTSRHRVNPQAHPESASDTSANSAYGRLVAKAARCLTTRQHQHAEPAELITILSYPAAASKSADPEYVVHDFRAGADDRPQFLAAGLSQPPTLVLSCLNHFPKYRSVFITY